MFENNVNSQNKLKILKTSWKVRRINCKFFLKKKWNDNLKQDQQRS